MGQKKSTSISSDLLQLYRRCIVHNLIHCPLVIFHFYLYMYVFLICFHMLLNKYVFFFCSIYNIWSSKTLFSHINFMVALFFCVECCLVDLNSVPQPQGVNILVWSLKLVAARICAVSFDFFFVNVAGMNKLKITSQLPLFFFFFLTFLVLNNLELTRISLCFMCRCHQVGKSLSAANCSACRGSLNLATCLDCSAVFCDK